ncbi:MAG: hypothetical protein NTV79_10850 [Candidatus Aureabacteria bacterium]|nr:hypothetical protein [Candidatus Auribacterota bacterium]
MKKIFNAVDWMRSRRIQIDREDRGLSWEERYLKTLHLLEHDFFWRKIKDRAEKSVHPQTMAVAESPDNSYGKSKG